MRNRKPCDPAGKTGADVTGLDSVPELIEKAKRIRAGIEGGNIRFDVGDAEAMPYEAAEFDIGMSMFGACSHRGPMLSLPN